MTRHALDGVRVIDFSWVWAGPLATKTLGAMGAEIIKVESATRPEYTNRIGWFRVINNNKRSCSINLRHPEGQALARQLVAIGDVVVENFSAGVLQKLGLGQDDLRRIRPDLVFVSASGVGRDGPQRDALAYGTLLQAYSGRAGMIGTVNPHLEAMGIQPAWTDPVTAMWETLAILAALAHRRRTGQGAVIDISMLESTVALLPEVLLRQGLGVAEGAPSSNTEAGAAPCGCFHCAGQDDWLALSVRSDAEWRALCEVMARPDLAADARYADGARRESSKAALDDVVSAWLRRHSAHEAETLLQARGVPAARSRHLGEVIEDPHVAGRKLFPALPDGWRATALPWVDEAGWRGSHTPTPALGADNDYVLGTLLGLSRARIDELIAAEAIR